MELTIAEAAQLLGKSDRQVRYMIRKQSLQARKVAGQWRIDRDSLPMSEGQARASEHKLGRARRVVEESLGTTLAVADKEAMERRRRYRVAVQPAFQLALPVYREAVGILGAEHDAALALRQALFLITEGWHEFRPAQKIEPLRKARVCLCHALTELLLADEESTEISRLCETIELQVLPSLGGLLRHAEKGDRDR
jgi:excisionase family DNA binding protein